MNKKFSTLVAGLVLASGVAYAQHSPSAGAFPYRTQNTLSTAVGDDINQIQSMNRWYQLTDGTNVLVQVRDQQTGAVTLKMLDPTEVPSEAPLNASLWKIKVTTHPTTASKTFTYINKETNLELILDHTKAVKYDVDTDISALTIDGTILDGCTSDWGWYSTDVQTSDFTVAPIYSYFNAASDSVMVMQLNAADEVVAVKYSKDVAKTGLTGLTHTLNLKPVIAGEIVLTAQDINQMIDAQAIDSAKFKFNIPNGLLNSGLQDIFSNTLASTKYEAQDAVFSQEFGNLALKVANAELAAAKDALDDAKAALDAVTVKGDAALGSTATADAATAAATAATTANNAATAASTAATAALTATDNGAAAATALETAKNALDAAKGALDAAKTALTNAATAIESSLTAEDDKPVSDAAKIAADLVGIASKAADEASPKLTSAKTALSDAKVADFDEYAIRLAAPIEPVAIQKYFMVDTARYEGAQSPSLSPAYKLVNKEIKNLGADGGYVFARYFFKLTYYPSNDSLFIEPLNAASATDAEMQAGTPWLETKAGSQWVKDADVTAANLGIAVSNTDCTTSPVSLTTTVLSSTGKTVATVGRLNPAGGFDTRISFNHEYPYFVRTSLPQGAYYAKLVTKRHPVSSTNRADGQYLVANMAGTIVYDEWASTQDFEHMPATQWVVETLGCVDAVNPRVRITNREYNNLVAFEGQLYKAGEDTVYFINHTWNELNVDSRAPYSRFTCQDTIMFTAVKDVKAAQAGFLNLSPDQVIDNSFKLKHFSDYGDVYLKALVGTKDTLLNVAADGSNFELVPYYNNNEYGKVVVGRTDDTDTIVPQLYRSVYLLKVKDFDKVNNDLRFVGITKEGNYAVIDTITKKSELAYPAYFFLKENDHKDAHAYALVNKNAGYNSDGSSKGIYYDGADKLFVENKTSMAKKGLLSERQTDAFFMVQDTMPYYKRLAGVDTVAFYDAINENRVLIEDCNSPYSKDKGAGFLGFRSLAEAPALNAAPSMYVDTAYVRNETRMPLYLLAVGAELKDTKACDHAFDVANPGHTEHFASRPYVQGRYLVDLSNNNLVDSIPYIDAKNAIHEGIYTRLAFVNAIHMGDSVYILNDPEATYEYEDSIKHYAVATLPISAETYNGATVAFRLKNQDDDENFYIETNGRFAGFASNGGAWVKNQNNVAVLATSANEFYEDHDGMMVSYAQEDIYQGTVFTLKQSTENPTANEEVVVEGVKVLAQNGKVQIAGAAGKKVVITNILGQAVANTVITSDNATIAVPAGVVVVAVEGEDAVKAIVK
ncbi:hypothetical protein DWU89_16440 [Parabacteroides acidifaciens]|uniref:DUF6383 domain-containing protein n=2 Tax=Parabacteroides acidifaciens TaxID=2290935 RepID=A0A3D8HAL8_9BACT|nr:hypothetical protein DWU89_16440 [Parabacteroides acidifaciens]